jgi:two-component system, chemotaxis family, protein-glutamate methylesterase/glutaminase
MKGPKFVIVVGTSAGGMNALIELVAQFNEDIERAIGTKNDAKALNA